MAQNLGGLPAESYIYCSKTPKLQAISHRRYRSSVLLVRFAQPAKLRLQNRGAIFPLRMTYSGFIWLGLT